MRACVRVRRSSLPSGLVFRVQDPRTLNPCVRVRAGTRHGRQTFPSAAGAVRAALSVFFFLFVLPSPHRGRHCWGFCLSCPQLYILLRCCPNCPPPPPPPTFLDPGPEPAGGYHDNDFGCVCLSVCVRVCRVFVLHVYVGFLGVCLVSVCVCLCPLGVPWPVFLFCVAPLFSVFLLFFKKKMCRDVVRKSGLYLLSYA